MKVGRWTRYSAKNIITVGSLLALRLAPLPMFASGCRFMHLAERLSGLHLQFTGIYVRVVLTSCPVSLRVVLRHTFQALLSMEVTFHDILHVVCTEISLLIYVNSYYVVNTCELMCHYMFFTHFIPGKKYSLNTLIPLLYQV